MSVSGLAKLIVGALAVGLVTYAALVAYLWAAQDWLLFPGRSSRGTTAARLPEGAEEISGLRAGAISLYGLYLPAADPRQALLFFGGNAEYVAVQMPELESLRDLGADVLAVDYPGYGGSGGRPSEQALSAAALAAYDELARRSAGREIIVIGRSLGAFPALQVAAERDVAATVLLAPFTSATSLVRATLPFIPASLLLRHRLDNLATLARVDVPLVVIHNRDDEIVPFRMGEAIAAAAGVRGRLVESDGGGHNSMAILPGSHEMEVIAGVLAEQHREAGPGRRRPQR